MGLAGLTRLQNRNIEKAWDALLCALLAATFNEVSPDASLIATSTSAREFFKQTIYLQSRMQRNESHCDSTDRRWPVRSGVNYYCGSRSIVNL